MKYPPLQPKTATNCKEIGEIIVQLARGQVATKQAEQEILDRVKRKDGTSISHASLTTEIARDDKVVVVPDDGIIDFALEELENTPNADGYPLLEPYMVQAARVFRKRALDQRRTVDEVVQEAANEPDTLKDFFHVRLGEYCISQCK